MAKKHEQVLEIIKLLLRITQKCYKVEYEVGQKVLLNVKGFRVLEGLNPKFMSKFVVPFPIMK